MIFACSLIDDHEDGVLHACTALGVLGEGVGCWASQGRPGTVDIICHARVSVLLRLDGWMDGWDSEYSSSFSSCYHVAFAGGGNRK